MDMGISVENEIVKHGGDIISGYFLVNYLMFRTSER